MDAVLSSRQWSPGGPWTSVHPTSPGPPLSPCPAGPEPTTLTAAPTPSEDGFPALPRPDLSLQECPAGSGRPPSPPPTYTGTASAWAQHQDQHRAGQFSHCRTASGPGSSPARGRGARDQGLASLPHLATQATSGSQRRAGWNSAVRILLPRQTPENRHLRPQAFQTPPVPRPAAARAQLCHENSGRRPQASLQPGAPRILHICPDALRDHRKGTWETKSGWGGDSVLGTQWPGEANGGRDGRQ